MADDVGARVQALLDEMIATGPEVGLQVAAYHRGELVVDAWAGVADTTTARPIDGDTVFVTFSVSKGVTATIAHLLAERGQLDYDAPIADVGRSSPSTQGADHPSPRADPHGGLAHLPIDLRPEDVIDWDRMCAILETSTPAWEPGTKTGYHALTFGWLVGELVHRNDGRPVERILAEDVCAPLASIHSGSGCRRRRRRAWLGSSSRRVQWPIRCPWPTQTTRPSRSRRASTTSASLPTTRRFLGQSFRPRAGGRQRAVPRAHVRVARGRRRRWAEAPVSRACHDRLDPSDRRGGCRRQGPWAEGVGATSSATSRPSRRASARVPSGIREPAASGLCRSRARPRVRTVQTHMLAEIDRVNDPARRFERELHALFEA